MIAKQVDGAWYFSPMATGSEQVLAVVRALSREEIEQLQEQIADVAGSIDEDVGSAASPSRRSTTSNGPATTTGRRRRSSRPPTTRVPTDDTIDGESAPSDESVPSRSGARPATARTTLRTPSACFDEVVAAGEIDAVGGAVLPALPGVRRWPSSAGAATTTRCPTPSSSPSSSEAAPCFQDLVDAGELEDYELPVEIDHPECLDGRNWYAATDDEPTIGRASS